MNRRTFVIAVTSAMLITGGVGALIVHAEPGAAPASQLATAGASDATRSPATRTATPTPTPTPTTPPAPAPAPPVEAPPAEEPAPPPPAPAATPEDEVLALTNARRAENGCGALAWDGGLAGVAQAHSADMAGRDYFSHTTPEGVDPFQRAAAAGQTAYAENIAAGQSTPAEVMDGWMTSEGHRANILNCSLTRLGVGVGHGGSYGIYWTQLFG